MWIGWQVIKYDMPNALDTISAVEVKTFSIKQKMTLPFKEETANLGYFTILLEKENFQINILNKETVFSKAKKCIIKLFPEKKSKLSKTHPVILVSSIPNTFLS